MPNYYLQGRRHSAGGSAYLFQDTFTDSDATTLTAHTPDVDQVGGGWIERSASMSINSNEAVTGSSSGNEYNGVVADVGTADIILNCKAKTTNNSRISIVCRMDSGNDCLVISRVTTTGWLEFWHYNSGTFGKLDRQTGKPTLANDTYFNLKIVLSGADCEVFWDDVSQGSIADAPHIANTEHGLGAYQPTTRWDDLTIEQK